MKRRLGPEAARNWERRQREGFIAKYLSGNAVLDIGYRGGVPDSEPITETAIGIDLDYPGYDGKTLPFPALSQDAVFASHVLEHIEDWQGALADWYRVLKIGGHLVIAVPHRDLYERKSAPPSRFNLGHKRFYSPASLLAEIEEALPVAGYRIRSLRDIDDGFDYGVPPERHAAGCYEIELVIQKIAIPHYAELLRPSPAAADVAALYASLAQKALDAFRHGEARELTHLQEVMALLPLPPFAVLRTALAPRLGGPGRRGDPLEELRPVLAPLVARQPFRAEWYLAAYPDVAKAAAADPRVSAHMHYVRHGYFEGRSSGETHPVFR
jgi:Methyltransferase domain